MNSQAPILQLAGVSKKFGGVRALQDVDFELRRGEVHCLAGENGCGKSTLIKVITGVHAPEPGSAITFDGEPAHELTPALARQHGIQVIWQDLALFPEMSVAENISFEMNLGRMPRWGQLFDNARKSAADDGAPRLRSGPGSAGTRSEHCPAAKSWLSAGRWRQTRK